MVPNTPYIWDAEKAFSNLVEKYFANNEDAKLPETIKEIKDEGKCSWLVFVVYFM